MKKIIISLLAVLAFSWASGVAADQSSESIVTCGAGNGDAISMLSLPETINNEGCPGWEGGACAPCIISLEKQGCKIVDIIVTHFRGEGDGVIVPGTTYLLSCVKP